MGPFSGIKNVQIENKFPKLSPGFMGQVRINKCSYKPKCFHSKAPAVFVEFTVVSSNMPVEHPVGATRSWKQDMSTESTALGALKAFLFAIFGATSAEAQAAVTESAEAVLDEAMGPGQKLKGQELWVETGAIVTQKGHPFTVYLWSPKRAAGNMVAA